MERATKCVYWAVVGLALVLVMAICGIATPAKAHAAESSGAQLVAAKSQVLTTQSSKKVTAAKTKVTNPYTDVISGKTVDKTGYNAVKYVKAHKGFTNVITGKRFYPTKTFTRAQYTKILRNLYGNTVALSKSKTAVTAKYACDQLTKVAKNTFGVKIKWKSGNGSAKLSRTGCSNYIKTFATWSGGIFAPKQ